MASLAIFFSGSVSRFEMDSGFLYFEAVIIRIDEVCLELGEFYINNPFGVAFNANPMNL